MVESPCGASCRNEDPAELVPPARLERATPRLEIWCSVQLSYGGICLYLLGNGSVLLNLNHSLLTYATKMLPEMLPIFQFPAS